MSALDLIRWLAVALVWGTSAVAVLYVWKGTR